MPSTEHPVSAAFGTDLSGRQLGNYQLLRRLGRGAMAEVYLAEQISLRRQVAFKVLRADLATDASYVQRFHREAQAAASLIHANIVQIYEVGCIDGIHFIAQEYVQGSNLGELLIRRGPPTLKQSLGIMLQVAAALHKAAEHGIVHRDIKPENIMLAESFDVKVADFGLARAASDQNSTSLTQTGFTMGTPLYMSPEQVEGKPLDGRSDIYSLGVTCYHMLTGQPPFRGETALSVAVQHIREQPARLDNLRPDLPSALCRIIHKMLAKEPKDRHPDARELARDLRAVVATELGDHDFEDFLRSSNFALPSATSRQSATARLDALMKTTAMQAPRRSQKWWWAAGVAVAFLAGLGIARALSRPLIRSLPPNALNVKKDNAKAQFLYASIVDTEDAWKSVWFYFPEDRLWELKAKKELAWMYLGDDDLPRAKVIFDELGTRRDVEVQYRAFGLGGQAIVLAKQGRYQEARDKLAELWEIRQSLDEPTRRLLVSVLQRNRKALAGPVMDQWMKFLQSTLSGRKNGGRE